ncbi:MAG: RHS repeat-associated core domain-containing protein [Bryobacterales bacterium]|nr:RHS repeat-associated core domain-containing protein [Bryobacterales bacterium]
MTKRRLRLEFSGVTRDLDTTASYDTQGRLTTAAYPLTGEQHTYEFDTMGRPQKLRDQSWTYLVWDTAYGAADQMLTLATPQWTETRQYNARLQLTRIQQGSGFHLEYRYAASGNNGRVTQQKDWVSGEEINYSYDVWNRLSAAQTTGPEWGQAFTFDGFGNRLSQTVTKGSAPQQFLSYNGLTNRISDWQYAYDANGNLTAMPSMWGMTYDVENRLVAANGEEYGYAPDNRRVYKKQADGTEWVYFYGVTGQRLGTYRLHRTPPTWLEAVQQERYFAGRRLKQENRIGSVNGKYWAYGENYTGQGPWNDEAFATYYRDSGTGLDYADQRYYGSTMGRFLTADPYLASGGPAEPGSWNRYAYVKADPVNYHDPTGLVEQCPDGTRTGPDGRSCVAVELPTMPSHRGGGGWGPEHPQLEIYPGYAPPQEEAIFGEEASGRPLGFNGALNALARPDCFRLFGFRSASAAQAAFKDVNFTIVNLGKLEVETTTEGTMVAPGTPPPAQTVGSTVQVNYDYNWVDFQNVSAIEIGTGRTVQFNYLGAINVALGTNMNTTAFSNLLLLHEFRHLRGSPQETVENRVAFNREIFDNCIR